MEPKKKKIDNGMITHNETKAKGKRKGKERGHEEMDRVDRHRPGQQLQSRTILEDTP